MALTSLIDIDPQSLLQVLPLTFLIPLIVYRLFLHPLSSVPGPLTCRLTSLWTYIHCYLGDECSLITSYHERFGPVIRIAPNEICIADGSALSAIYSDEGGFDKADCYHNGDIDGHASLFSETDRRTRQPKAKSVVGLFSTSNLREGEKILKQCVDRLVSRLAEEKERCQDNGGSCNVLDLSRSLAVDAVSAYLFRTSYGGLEEQGTKGLSASEFVNAFVGVGRFFYLPRWAFAQLERASGWLFETTETQESMSKVDAFVTSVVNTADGDDDSTYQSRMLNTGLGKHEVAAQCKDLMFAGTDSSGMNLSTLVWQLARHPDIYATLRKEVSTAAAQTPPTDPSTLPYLRACIRETLRLSMANPTRLPRVVPLGGWSFHSVVSGRTYFFQPGTLVSCQIHTLHHNPTVYPDPYTFNPSRWIESEHYTPSMEMQRDFIPFSLGSRQCIARNLAMTELTLAAAGIVGSGVLDGAKTVGDRVEILEWFNSKVKGERIAITW